MIPKSFAAFLLALTLTGLGLARERPITKANVPMLVLQAVTTKYPGAITNAYAQEQDRGKTVYEVKLSTGEGKVDVTFAKNGYVLFEERLIARQDLPDEVKKALAARYAKAVLLKIEKVTIIGKADQPLFKFQMKLANRWRELLLDANGKLYKR